MLYHPGYQTIKHISILIEVVVVILNRDFLLSENILAHFRYAQAAFVKTPLFTFFFHDYRIYERLPERCHLLLLLLCILIIFRKRLGIYNKKPDRKAHL